MTPRSNEPVTVIIPTYNRSAYLLESLDSILTQTEPADRIIVVNDGSTDDTESVLRPYEQQIEYVYQENQGKSSALNNALSLVSEGWVWIFDDDDVALPDALERHKNTLEEQPHTDFTYSAFWFAEEDHSGVLERTTFNPALDQDKVDLFDALLSSCALSIQGMLTNVKCYHDLGGFDPTLDRAEDYEFFLRLAGSFQGTGIREATYLRRVHADIRGREQMSHAADSIQEVFLQFEREIFDKIYKTLSLECYIPGGFGQDRFADPAAERRALIKRSISMARKGLWDHAMTDWKRLDLLNGRRPLTQDEKEICFKAFSQEAVFEELRRSPGVLADLRTGLNSRLLREIKIVMGRGILSRLRQSAHRSKLQRVLDIVVMGRLYGYGTLFRSAMLRK